MLTSYQLMKYPVSTLASIVSLAQILCVVFPVGAGTIGGQGTSQFYTIMFILCTFEQPLSITVTV